jgi:hypothetical protein
VQVLDQLVLVTHLRALPVGVFDAQDEGAAVAPRKQPVVERGARVAHVQQASRGGRKPDADRIVRHDSFDDRRCCIGLNIAGCLRDAQGVTETLRRTGQGANSIDPSAIALGSTRPPRAAKRRGSRRRTLSHYFFGPLRPVRVPLPEAI